MNKKKLHFILNLLQQMREDKSTTYSFAMAMSYKESLVYLKHDREFNLLADSFGKAENKDYDL